VIKFKCLYCGQHFRTSDENGGKKAKCPKCKGIITIPAPGKSQSEIIDIKPSDANNPIGLGSVKFCEDIEPDYDKKWYRFLIPTYDELTVFLMSVSFILLVISNSAMRTFLWKFISDDWRSIFTVLIALVALGVCLYHPFTARKKSIGDKWLMLAVAVIANGGTGILAGNYMLEQTIGWLAIFPVWNIINGIILLAMFRFKAIDYRSISDRDTNTAEIILGLLVIISIYVACNFVYKLYWAVTLSVSVVYATSFSGALRTAFPGQHRIETSQPSENEISQ
jgi:hypothetical protein